MKFVENLLKMVQVFICSFAVDNNNIIAKGGSFSTLFISSCKYASACTSPKGTFRFSYFQKGDVKAVLDKVFIKGYVMIPNLEIKGSEALSTI